MLTLRDRMAPELLGEVKTSDLIVGDVVKIIVEPDEGEEEDESAEASNVRILARDGNDIEAEIIGNGFRAEIRSGYKLKLTVAQVHAFVYRA